VVEEPAAAAPAKSAAEAAVAMPVPRSMPSAVAFTFTFVPAHQAEFRAAEVMFKIKITSHGISPSCLDTSFRCIY
jgi:hypothetical protein